MFIFPAVVAYQIYNKGSAHINDDGNVVLLFENNLAKTTFIRVVNILINDKRVDLNHVVVIKDNKEILASTLNESNPLESEVYDAFEIVFSKALMVSGKNIFRFEFETKEFGECGFIIKDELKL